MNKEQFNKWANEVCLQEYSGDVALFIINCLRWFEIEK